MNKRPAGLGAMNGPMGQGQSAGLKKLGCRVGDIASEMFAPNSSSSTNGGKTVRSEFFGFWSQLTLPGNLELRPFLDKLLEQIQLVDQTFSTSTSNGIPPASIVNTIAFILLCAITTPTLHSSVVNVDKLQALHHVYSTGLQSISSHQNNTGTLQMSQQEANAVRFVQAVDSNASLKSLMRLIAIRTLHSQNDNQQQQQQPPQQQPPLDIDSVLSPLVMYAAHLIPKDVRFLDWLRLPTIDQTDIQTNEAGFLYYFLTTLLQDQQRQNHINTEIVMLSILKAICDKCHSLPQQLRMSLPVAETTFLALLHMMKAFVSMQSVRNVDFLEKAIRLLSSFRWFHYPIGFIAEQTIHLLKQEQLTPGFNRRRLITNESLVVNYVSSPNSLATSPPPSVVQNTVTQPTQYKFTKPIFYLYDTLDQSCLSTLNMIDPVPYQQQNIVKPYATPTDPSSGQYPPVAIVVQTLVHALDAICPLSQSEVDLLCSLSLHHVAPFITRLEQLEEQYRNDASKGEFLVEKRELDFNSLKSDLLALGVKNKGNPDQFSLPQHYNLVQEQPGLYQSQYPAPAMPLIEHIRVPVELRSKQTEHEGTSQPGYPAVAMFEKLLQILTAYNPHADKTTVAPPVEPGVTAVNPTQMKAREIRFVLIGSDKLVQHVVTAYFFLRSSYANLFNGLNVKFFLVPASRNHLANYIAKIDLWYFRHIFTPFRSPFPFLIPFLREDEIEVRFNNESGLVGAPTQFLRESVVQYVREAHHVYKPIIYKVEGRVDINSIEPSDVIPFLQRVEVGLIPAIEEFRIKSGQSYAQMSQNEIQKDKNFIYSPVDLIVKYSKVDLVGQPKPEVVDDSIPYQSILVSHVPRKGDLCTAPDPASVGIELYAQPSKVDKAKIKKNSLFYEQRQHVAELTCSSTVPFKVVVDGVLHGPFRSIRVAVAQTKSDGKIAHFPIQTFFPVQQQ